MRVYQGEFRNWDDLVQVGLFDFLAREPKYILTSYDVGGWDGEARVLWYHNRKWWYVADSHCSCYGLRLGGQPAEHLTIPQLKKLMEGNGWFGDNKVTISNMLALTKKARKTLPQ